MDTEIGLYYLVTRYYDPVTYRFINADGYFQTGQGFLDKNMSAYCLNNPVMRYDPTGTCSSILCAGRGVCKSFPGVPRYDYSNPFQLISNENQNKLPMKGEPNSTATAPNGNKRTYDEDGNPEYDTDYSHPHHHPELTNPHIHDWVWNGEGFEREKKPYNLVTPSEFGWSLPSFSFDNFKDNVGKIGDAINGIVNTGDPLQEAVWDVIHFFGG